MPRPDRKTEKVGRNCHDHEALIDSAIGSPYRDFEDSIQYHCALAAGFDTLITRNTRDYPKGGLTIMTPRQYLDMIGTPKSGGAAPRGRLRTTGAVGGARTQAEKEQQR